MGTDDYFLISKLFYKFSKYFGFRGRGGGLGSSCKIDESDTAFRISEVCMKIRYFLQSLQPQDPGSLKEHLCDLEQCSLCFRK